MAAYLAHNSSVSLEFGLDPKRTPSKSAIARACGRIPDSYLKRIHERIASVVEAGSVSGDSTGYSRNRFKRWYDIRTKMLRRYLFRWSGTLLMRREAKSAVSGRMVPSRRTLRPWQ